MIKLKKKLAALEGEVGTQQELRQLQRELYDKEHQLDVTAAKEFHQEHPDAVKLKKEVIVACESSFRGSLKSRKY